ncbi:DEAD/DEAH box helicase family protein [Psychrobacter sp. FME13]|uniref:SNF2-related protein n=1 Tax=Psychrobacter sp. FME13 TaxID=2487708 RepID=UPI001788661C|nr:SNF2-related protein [Psychrobacter sp. FME13]MBE0440636.1 DEAD/DEAH box helicase family protein [Psychrobacter sp. FME13]
MKEKLAILKRLRTALASFKASDNIQSRASTAKDLLSVLKELGAFAKLKTDNTVQSNTGTKDQSSQMVDRSSIAVPEKAAARQKANDAAIELLASIKEQGLTRDDLTDEQLETLAKYTGSGGGLKAKADENGKRLRGSQYEYYTPLDVASALWDLASETGFSGGKVLDPSAGTGVFAATSPESAVIDSIELDETSGAIAQLLNDGERSKTIISPFEAQAKIMANNSLDMIITNVPFGGNKVRGDNPKEDDCYRKESLENYFILRSLEKLKYGGLAVFITPTSVVSGRANDKKKLRKLTSLKADFLGAYRMPTEVFDQTGASVVTDVVIYRKHSSDATDQIMDLYNGGGIDTLAQSKVFWDDYLSGDYFKKAEHKKFILGDETTTINQWGKEIETVKENKKNPKVSKMLKKFGDSRIDWDMLGSAGVEIIDYKNGDVVFQDGKQLEYQDGRWQAIEKEVTSTELEIQKQLASMGSAIDMVMARVTYEQISATFEYSQKTGQAGLIPSDALSMLDRASKSAIADRPAAWNCVLCAQAIREAIELHEYGYDFKNGEPEITDFMKYAFLDGKNAKLSGDAKQDHKFVALYYANGKYNDAWLGNINSEVVDNGAAKSYQSVIARIQYENKSLHITPEQLKQIDPTADPINNDDWFVNHDGSQIIAANDFLVGSLSDRLKDIDKQIELTNNEQIKAKLIKQKSIARDSVARIDVKRLELDLRTPLISAEDKVRFLKQTVHKDAFVAYNAQGRGIADIDIKGSSTKDSLEKKDKDKLYNRIGDWLGKGTVTLGSVKLETMSQREALNWMTEQINTANIKFNSWVKANKNIMSGLEDMMTNEDNLYFTQNADETPIDIAGMNPELSLHGYQNAEVRKQGRFFGGINGFGVGLGKTFTSLASVQHVHNIGVKKKTIFVVPNSVLSNWRKEAAFAYQNTDDCIFVGLREDGEKFRVMSNKYDEDLLSAIDGKYRKIFMTFEAFKRIRLKDSTLGDYADYIKQNDTAFSEKELQKDNEKVNGLTADLIERLTMNSNAPFLEDMRVDSVVIDEAHAFKNSITAPNTDDRIKYLSQPGQSARGEDAQAKLWYVRGSTPNNDGVQLLTATPITNSPLEIYSMLSLASGRDTINKMCGGINGADDFIQIMCQIQEEVMPTIDGGERSQNVFTGIRNANILRTVIGSNAVIKDAQDVGMSVVIPDREEVAVEVNLGEGVTDQLRMFQDAYTIAKQVEKDQLDNELNNPNHPQSPFNPNSPFSIIQKKYGEEVELMAHPFNLIRKMDVMIADSEFSEMATFYDFEKSQEKLAQSVIDKFNKKSYSDSRKRLSPYTNEDNAKAVYTKDGDTKVFKEYKITVEAKIVLHDGRKRIVVDTLNGKTQSRFEDIADKDKLNLDVTTSAKIAAMLENFKTEQAEPRGANADGTTSTIVKQIVFCDHLFLHNKIKKLIAKRAGVPASKIAIITGQINNEPDEMIDIQDGFNAESDDNQYQVIIANKKAEVGINLQRGTQAIHHLTTGWTPDSLEQRNGRGARQGNKTQKVAIYHYDADGTFDEFKRTMIDKKDEWISSVLKDDGKNTIEVTGSISRTEQDALISTMGNKDAMREYQATKDAKEKEVRYNAAVKRQSINMDVVNEQASMMANLSLDKFYEQAVINVVSLIRDNRKLLTKNEKSTAKADTRKKNELLYENSKQIALDQLNDILDSVSVQRYEQAEDWNKTHKYVPVGGIASPDTTADSIYDSIMNDTTEYPPSKTDEWAKTFTNKQVLGSPYSFSNDKLIINEGGIYQAAYDEVKETAEGLINQSVIAANYIAEETGIDGISLPADAGERIARKEAVIVNGVYIQVGSIVIKPQAGDRPDAIYVARMDSGKLTLSKIGKDRFSGSNGVYSISNNTPAGVISSTDKVINKGSGDYLSAIKQMAAFEDNLHLQGALKPLATKYSDMIPEVAEYRDDSIRPVWTMSADFGGSHANIENSPIAIVLPLFVLNAGTPFAKAMLVQYEKQGFEINLDNGTFMAKDDVTVKRNHYYPGQTDYFNAVTDLIKNSGVKIAASDKEVVDNDRILYSLLKENGAATFDAVKSAKESITAETDPASFEGIATAIFDNHLYDDKYIDKDIGDDVKLALINTAYKDASPTYIRSFDVIEYFTEALKKAVISEAASKAAKNGDSVEQFSENLGLDGSKLQAILDGGATEHNINEFGRFDDLKSTVDKEKAKAYFEAFEGGSITALKANMKVDFTLRAFILNNSKAADSESDLPPNTKVYISGDTKEHKDSIKAYAVSRGVNIDGTSKTYFWYGKKKVWVISLAAWQHMIADRPRLIEELTMQTTI